MESVNYIKNHSIHKDCFKNLFMDRALFNKGFIQKISFFVYRRDIKKKYGVGICGWVNDDTVICAKSVHFCNIRSIVTINNYSLETEMMLKAEIMICICLWALLVASWYSDDTQTWCNVNFNDFNDI